MPKHLWFSLVFAALILVGASPEAHGLPLGERQAAHFGREVVRTIREIITHPFESQGDTQVFTLDGKTIRETVIHSATIVFHGFSASQIERMMADGPSLDSLQAGKGIEVKRAHITPKAVGALITREISRVPTNKRIFDKVTVFFQAGQVQVSGLVDFRKIPGNLLAFLARDFSPFTATVAIRQEGSQLHLDIIDAMVNEQPMTPELRTQILAWLNPVWDFSILPYPAHLAGFSYSPDGIRFHGTIFMP